MTEAEWLACQEPKQLLDYLVGRTSNRKFRLFGCACCRGIWRLLADERSRRAVLVAERCADSLAAEGEMDTVRQEIQNSLTTVSRTSFECADSTRTLLSDILPKNGKRFAFKYEYGFGDGWEHEVLFEGCLPADPKTKYPHCLEGARACPPDEISLIPMPLG